MSKRVMILDDEPDIRLYLTTALQDAGFETCTADAGEDWIEFARSCKPDVIITDIMMPRRSGIAVYRELRSSKEFATTPTVLISGMTSAKDFFREAFRNLVDDDKIPPPEGYLEKPIDVTALVELVRSLAGEGVIHAPEP